MENLSLEFLSNQPLMKGLSELELKKITKHLTKITFESYDPIIEEGDFTTDIYFLVEGEVVVLKWDESKLFQLPIGKLKPGDMFGEMSFLDLSPRSATIEARKETVVYKLSRDELLKDLPEMQEVYNKILANIAPINAQRLRSSDQARVKTLRSSLHLLQRRIDYSILVILLAILMGLMNFIPWIPFSEWLPSDFTAYFSPIQHVLYSWGGWLLLLLPSFYIIRKLHYELNEFGINRNNMKMGAIETPFFILLGCLLVWITRYFISHEVDENTVIIASSAYLVGLYLLYCFAYEFIARGVLQNSLKNVISDEGGGRSILLTALFVTLVPFFSYAASPVFHGEVLLFTFIANVLLGKIYLHLDNLYGVTLIHFAVGLLANYLRVI